MPQSSFSDLVCEHVEIELLNPAWVGAVVVILFVSLGLVALRRATGKTIGAGERVSRNISCFATLSSTGLAE
jgi:hypothetical protein